MGVITRNSVVTDGLVTYIDVRNPQSYTSGSTSFRNLGSATSSITSSADNIYTGISIYATSSVGQAVWPPAAPDLVSSQQGTYSLWIKVPDGSTTVPTIIFSSGGITNKLVYFYRNGFWTPTNAYSWLIYYTGSAGSNLYLYSHTYTPNQWVNTVMTFTSTGTGSVYTNGVLINSQNMSNFSSWNRVAANTPVIRMYSTSSSAGLSTGEFGAFQYYDRALSQAEIIQNYNAIKTRYGLT